MYLIVLNWGRNRTVQKKAIYTVRTWCAQHFGSSWIHLTMYLTVLMSLQLAKCLKKIIFETLALPKTSDWHSDNPPTWGSALQISKSFLAVTFCSLTQCQPSQWITHIISFNIHNFHQLPNTIQNPSLFVVHLNMDPDSSFFNHSTWLTHQQRKKTHLPSNGKCLYPWKSTLNMYAIMDLLYRCIYIYIIYMAYVRQYVCEYLGTTASGYSPHLPFDTYRPALKSLWSWAGVIFTQPVPNSRSTIVSAITTILRSGKNLSEFIANLKKGQETTSIESMVVLQRTAFPIISVHS